MKEFLDTCFGSILRFYTDTDDWKLIEKKFYEVKRKLKYIYLNSSGYTGSTLLSFILGAHGENATIKELSNAIEKYDQENLDVPALS